MRSSSKILLPLVGLGVLLWVGCTTAYPTNYLSSTGPSATMVVNFEGGSPLAVNPNLVEANRPGNLVALAGALLLTANPASNASATGTLVSPGYGTTNFCYHVTGTVNDPGTQMYPSIQVQIPLDKSGTYSAFYDAQLFSGVKFYVKVMGSDTAGKRSFSIPVAQTQPPSAGGNCNQSATPNACYNDFNVTYPGTVGVWSLESHPFGDFTRGAYGAAISPTTLSGLNLQQIIMLDWTESNNNINGIINVDFYIDEVEFF